MSDDVAAASANPSPPGREVIGGKEKGRSRLPKSARGEPRVQSSQSRMPMTLGSVGWNIYPSAPYNSRRSGEVGAHQVIELVITMNHSS
jgi:hypothetical protein